MKAVTLADVSKNGRGYYGIGASAVPFSDELYTYLRITDINDDGTLNMNDLKSVDDESASEYLLEPNDIVFARTGASTGRNYFYDGSDGEFVYAGFLNKFSIDPIRVNPKYIKYYCQSAKYKGWIQSFNTGSTRGNINAKTLAQMPIPLIPREQQDVLVSVLSSLDEKIKNNNEVNKNLEQQARALMIDYCDKVYEGAPLGTIMSFINGFAFKSSTYLSNGEYRIITIKNVQDGQVDAKVASFINTVPFQMKPECNLQIGDVLISLTGNIGRVGIVCEDNLLLNQRVAKFQPFDRRNLPFLYFYYRLPETKTRLETIAKGTAQANLSTEEILKLEFPFNQSLMSELSDLLSGMFSIIENNQIQNLALAEMRDTLLPRLMSGELDVSNIDL